MVEQTRRLTVRIDEQDADAEAIEELTSNLRTEIRALDAEAERAGGGEAPPGTRAVELIALGTLIVTLAQSDVLAAVINAVSTWAGRNLRRTVRIELDGDVLEMTGHGAADQKRLTEAWLARRTPAVAPASQSRRHALIVAGYEFQDPGLRRLRAPAHDAEALSSVLNNPAIGDFTVRTLLNEPAPVINEAIEEFFADRKPDDLLLLHFSGHGVKDEEGELYFATAATKLNRLGATAVSADFVNKRMNRSRSRRIVLLLDCCYAGAFGRGMVPRAGKQMDIQEHFGGRGRAVITASNASEYAFEGADLADSDPTPSVFTSALVEGLKTGDADADQDGFVGLDELYEYVYDKVRRTTPNQTPGKWTFDLQGDLRIAKRGRPVTRPSALPTELQAAIDHPLAGVRAGAVTELTRLLTARHGGIALAARMALERLSDDDSRDVSSRAAAALETVEPVAAEPVAPEPVVVAVASPVAMTTPAIVEPLPEPVVVQPDPVIARPEPVVAQPEPVAVKAEPVAKPESLAVPKQKAAPAPIERKPAEPVAAPEKQPSRRPSRFSVEPILAWIAIGALLAELAQRTVFQPFPVFNQPYMHESGVGLAIVFMTLMLPALVAFLLAQGRARTVARSFVVATAAGTLGMMYFSNYPHSGSLSDQLFLVLVGCFAGLGAVLVESVRTTGPAWLRATVVGVLVVTAGVVLYGVLPRESSSDVPAPGDLAYPIGGLLLVFLVLTVVRWLRDRGPILAVVLGAVTTLSLLGELYLAHGADSPVYVAQIVALIAGLAVIIAIAERDDGRMLSARLGVIGGLLGTNMVAGFIFQSSDHTVPNLVLIGLAVLAIGTYVIGARTAKATAED